jgi:hypothetical protein
VIGACYRGSRGMTGPSGQSSVATLATPGVTPATSAADVLWPPGDESLPYPATLDIEFRATATRAGSATRDLQTVVKVKIDAIAGMTIKGQVSSELPINSTGWTGTATLGTATVYIDGSTRKVRLPATASGADVAWTIDGAYLRRRLG